ncbi:MAG: branched-chain amino acid transport system II carrier protein [Christensenellales bacterium]
MGSHTRLPYNRVGLPLLGVASLGMSRSNGLLDMSSKVGKPFGKFFTIALYLTIGPFFAIPRCAATSFTIGFEQALPLGDLAWLFLLLFSAAFFIAVLAFSLFPERFSPGSENP